MYTACTPTTLSEQEIKDLVESGVKKRLNMDFDEFLEKYRSGQLENRSAVADLIMLLDLLEHEPACSA